MDAFNTEVGSRYPLGKQSLVFWGLASVYISHRMLCFSHFLFLTLKLSPKSEELQQNTTESQKRLNELEDLKEQLESRDLRLQTVEKEKTLIAEQLQQTLVEVRTLIQEKKDLKQLQKSLQIERDQLKSDIQDTVNMVRL